MSRSHSPNRWETARQGAAAGDGGGADGKTAEKRSRADNLDSRDSVDRGDNVDKGTDAAGGSSAGSEINVGKENHRERVVGADNADSVETRNSNSQPWTPPMTRSDPSWRLTTLGRRR